MVMQGNSVASNIYFLNFALLSLTDDQYSCKTYIVGVNVHGKILDGKNFGYLVNDAQFAKNFPNQYS